MTSPITRRAALMAAAGFAALTLAGGVTPSLAQDAQTYPDRPVHIIVGANAGASADMLARTTARKLSEITGQSFIVENIVGGSGNIAAEHVARAAPDGYTILLSGDALSINGTLFSDLTYDPVEDFAGVTKAVVSPQILVGKADIGITNLEEYIELVREKNGAFPYGRLGAGGIAHIANEILSQETGTQVTYIPYTGGAPATADLLGGHIDATIITLAAVTEHVRAGSLVPIAVTTPYRSPALPDVPTFDESGLPGFSIESWQGFVVPSATPRPVVERVSELFREALNDPEVKSFLEGQGFSVVATTGDELDASIRHDVPRYAAVIESSGITID